MIKPALQDDAFIADVMSARDDRLKAIHLWWLGQSGFLLQSGWRHLLFDPYLSDSLTKKYAGTNRPHVRMSERVVEPHQLDFIDLLVTASHAHTDHLDPDTLVHFASEIVCPNAIIDLVFGRAIACAPRGIDAAQTLKLEAFEFHAVPAIHDPPAVDEQGRYRHLGYVVRCDVGNVAVYHSGDTIRFDEMVELLQPHNIDIAILPINGKLNNMNGAEAARLAKEIGAKIVIPCHYDMFEFNTADPYEQFVPECQRIGQAYRVLKLGERFTFPEK